MKLISSILFALVSSVATAQSTTEVRVEGSRVHANMIQYLHDGGMTDAQIVDDAELLRSAGAAEELDRRGFTTVSSDDADPAVYENGPMPSMYGLGQRALIYRSGKVGLTIFAENSANHANFIEIISIGESGEVTNSVARLPN